MPVAEVIVATPRGFCAGVVRAIRIVEIALDKFGPPVYVKHAVVHNGHVVSRLEAMGAITVDSVDEVPEGATVVFSAHGSPPADLERAKERHLRVIDAVCPLVTRVHNEVKKYAREGRAIVVVGHPDHVEVIGTAGHSLQEHARTVLVDPDGALDMDFVAGGVSGAEIAVVTQTTLSQDDVAPAIEAIKQRFPDAVIRNDICYATTNRQEAVKQLAENEKVDCILVVGSDTSSNCKRLAEVAAKHGVMALLVDGPERLNEEILDLLQGHVVGVTSGASTPEELVEAVIERLQPEKITYQDGPEENITFTLPKELHYDPATT